MGLGYYEVGGFKTVIDNLSKYLPRYGVEVTVAARVVRVEPPSHINLIRLTPEEFLREAKHFDIIHIHTSYPYTKAVVKAGLRNIVFTWHGYAPSIYVPGLRNKFINIALKHLYSRILPKIKWITAVSLYASKQLLNMYGIRSKVIYNGVDLELFKPCLKRQIDEPIILNMTAYNNFKGRDLLIKFFKFILRKYPNVKLLARGIGVNNRNIIDITSYLRNEDIPKIYCLSNMYLLTSRWESFGLPIIESFATGTPVVALDRDDARREHIINSGAGLLFRDSKSLLEAVDEVLRNWQEYSRRGINYAQRFSWDLVAREYVKLYEEVLSDESTKQ